MFHDVPLASTSHSRAKTSKFGLLPRTRSRRLTGPMTSCGSLMTGPVKTRTSSRASSLLLSFGPKPLLSMRGPPTEGVGSCGS